MYYSVHKLNIFDQIKSSIESNYFQFSPLKRKCELSATVIDTIIISREREREREKKKIVFTYLIFENINSPLSLSSVYCPHIPHSYFNYCYGGVAPTSLHDINLSIKRTHCNVIMRDSVT